VSLLSRLRSKFAPRPTPKPRKKNYNAAGNNDSTYGWTSFALTSSETLKRHLETLRARSREQYENNPHLRRWIQLLKNNVVGPQGTTLQARTKTPSGKTDEAANLALEKGWKEWGREVDMGGRLTWREALNLFVSTASTDGEVFVQKVYPTDGYGFKLDFIDPHLLSTGINEEGKNGSRIVMGIELDRWNKPQAYYLPDTDGIASDDYYWHYGRPHKRVPAENIIHAFASERVDQFRGIPWASNSLLRMQMLDGYTHAELTKAEGEASKMAFLKQTNPDAAPYNADEVTDAGDLIQYTEPGIIERLPYGYEMQEYNPTSPNANYSEFAKAMLRDIAASLGVSYFSLANDLEGVNYTSSRTGLLEDREAWKALQEWVIESFCRPVYEAWLTPALASGLMTVNGAPLNPTWEPKYKEVSFQGPRWQWVDPQKEVNAYKEAVALGINSRSNIMRGLNMDPDEIWNELAMENDRLAVLTAPAGETNGE
jgi:lambda family phage portal protein